MFKLGKNSLKKLEGVDPRLQALAKRAIELTEVDFAVTYGLRTKEEQAELVKKGYSKTMNSRHLTGHAIDVAAWVNGRINYDLQNMYKIAQAFRVAAKELNIPIRWGGCWKDLQTLETIEEMADCVQAYVKSKQYRGKDGKLRSSALVDTPHFEIPRGQE